MKPPDSTRNSTSYNQQRRHVYCLQLDPTFPALMLDWEHLYASYHKPALHINAHFPCMWHFEQRRENILERCGVEQLCTQHPAVFTAN